MIKYSFDSQKWVYTLKVRHLFKKSNTYVGNKLNIDGEDVKYVWIQISCKNT